MSSKYNKSKTIFLVLTIIVNICKAQQPADCKFLFKTWLFLDHINTAAANNKYSIKDSTLFSLFNQDIVLKFDTLKAKNFGREYIFLAVAVLKDNKPYHETAITYQVKEQIEYIDIPVNNCAGYTLCINKVTGQSYRLQGFNGCDFLNLLRDIEEAHLQKDNERLSDKQFLSEYSVEGVDFNCLYEGLKSNTVKYDSFPCLQRCRDLW